MESQEKELISKLVGEYPELKNLVDQHQIYKDQLEEMKQRPYLTTEEDLECKRIQKAKLLGKDQIQKFLAEHSR